MGKFYIQCNDAGEHPRFWNESSDAAYPTGG